MRCLLADDHPALATAVADFLADNGFEVVGPAANGTEALELARTERPDSAVVDYRMPGVAGGELVTRLHEELGAIPVVVYTAEAGDDDVRRLLEAGATGVVLKEAPLDDLKRALAAVQTGATYVDPVLAARALDRGKSNSRELTSREREVLSHLAEGRSHEEIGRELSIGVETVRTHLRKASEKLGASTRTQAVASALRLGLID